MTNRLVKAEEVAADIAALLREKLIGEGVSVKSGMSEDDVAALIGDRLGERISMADGYQDIPRYGFDMLDGHASAVVPSVHALLRAWGRDAPKRFRVVKIINDVGEDVFRVDTWAASGVRKSGRKPRSPSGAGPSSVTCSW